MAIQSRNKLKSWFQTGAYPTQVQFWEWLDSFLHKTEDQIGIDNISGLRQLLAAKADQEAYATLYQLLQETIARTAKIVRTDITSPMSDKDLNTLYPQAAKGTQVICPQITGGGELYEKYDDQNDSWFRLYMTKGASNSPGVIMNMELNNFV
ncbi:hypothetical protein [Chitinophaga varians]|uniref:hypothetical protein n=1 Tax=Chitinophaga varians TaxID=2202339 RepID=UPI00165FE5B7|nr:hypothetical protein [Chitinophaga varians]MBC9915007.1 hypothetical protein [Chitinophaga varians]